MQPTGILIISEYDLAWWKKLNFLSNPYGTIEELMIVHPPEGCLFGTQYIYASCAQEEGYECIDDYLKDKIEGMVAYTNERKKVSETVTEILKDENIDWSLETGGRDIQYGVPADMDAWHLWLEKGMGKVFKAAPLPPSAFIDVHHFWDFIYEGGDLYEMEPFEASSLTDEQALKMLLVLEVCNLQGGLCWFYRYLRDRFGFPWMGADECDEDLAQLNVEHIFQIVKSHRNKPAPLRLTCETE